MKKIYQAMDNYMYRMPVMPSIRDVASEESLLELCKDPVFIEKITVASPALEAMITTYLENPEGLSNKKKRHLLASVKKYYLRSIERTTPFGLFAGCGIGSYSDLKEDGDAQSEGAKWEKCVNLDTEWLYSYIRAIEKNDRKYLSFKLNGAYYADGIRSNLLYSLDADKGEVTVRRTKVLEIIENICGEYKEYKEIRDAVKKEYADTDNATIEQYLDKLIEEQILISEIRPSLLSTDMLNDVIQKCRENGLISCVQNLEYVQNMIFSYKEKELGCGKEEYVLLTKKLKEIQAATSYVHVDTIEEAENMVLPIEIKYQIEQLASFFTNMSLLSKRQHNYLDEYKDKFIDKYGYLQEIPLMEMLDTTHGIGAPNGYKNPENDFSEVAENNNEIRADVKARLLKEYEKAINEGTCITLDDRYIAGIEKETGRRQNLLSMDMYFSIRKEGQAYRIYFEENGGTFSAGKSFGRFSAVSPIFGEIIKEINARESNLLPENVHQCEISFLPVELRNGNVCKSTSSRKLFMSAYTGDIEGKDEVKLEDVLIGVSEEKFYARHRKTGAYLHFGENNMYNVMLHPNAYRFLLEMDISQRNLWSDQPWRYVYSNYKHVPEIQYKNIVISREKWRLYESDFLTDGQADPFHAFCKQLLKMCQEMKIPQEVYLTENDNRIRIDIKDDISKKILYDAIKGGDKKNGITIEKAEDLTGIGNIKTGWSALEIVVPLFSTQKEHAISGKVPIKRASKDERRIYPYDNWLYFKLYCKKDRENELIALNLKRDMYELKNDYGIDHFFIRYIDSKPHIRLRLHGTRDVLLAASEKLLAKFHEYESDNLLSDVQIGVYEREMERYGGKNLISYAENLFCIDSQIVEETLLGVRTNKLDLDLDEAVMASILVYLEQIFDDTESRIEFMEKVYANSKYKVEFKEKKAMWLGLFDVENEWSGFCENESRREYMELLRCRKDAVKSYIEKIKDYDSTGTLRNDIACSILHMHCNRMIGTNREEEKKIMAFTEMILFSKKYVLTKGQYA